jgi:hypothetical protein
MEESMSNARKDEAEAVRTTIVGGRPPGSGRNNVPVPRGIEVLVKKASVDAEFRELLLKQRGKAAAAIQLELDPAENAMLSAIPQEQLAQTVDQTTVPMELRSAFQGRVALVMLAALGASLAASSPAQPLGSQPNQSNAIPPQAQATNPSSYTGPPRAVAGALRLPDKTNTNVPPTNATATNAPVTNPPPPQPPFEVAGLIMRVPPSPPTNAPATNPPPPQAPLMVRGIMRQMPPSPPTNAPGTNAPGELTRTDPPATNMPPSQTVDTVVVFGLMATLPTNTTPGEPPRTNPPSTNEISPPIKVAGLMVTPPTNATPDEPPRTNLPSTNEISPPVRGLQPNVPVAGLRKTPPTNAPPTNATIAEATPTNPPSTNVILPPIRGLRPNDPGIMIIAGAMAMPPAKAPPTNAPGTNAPGEITRTDPPSAKQPPAT